MDYLEELRGYSQGAKYEIETKLEMKQWEKKAAGNCKVLKKKKKADPTWCLVRYDGDGWGMKQDDMFGARENKCTLNKQGSQQKLILGEV